MDMGEVRELFCRLVENAFDFLARSVDELKDYPKYSVIHFYGAVELFLKARLMSEHWSLVVTRTKEPDWDEFVSGDFCSVSLNEAERRLRKITQSGLTQKEFDAFRAVGRHRNKMVHFFHDAHSAEENKQRVQEIAKQQFRAWYFLHRILTERWKGVFAEWSQQIKQTDEQLRNHREFLQVVFNNLGEDIKKRKEEGRVFRCCPSCGFESQEHRQDLKQVYDANCLVCGFVDRCLTIECSNCGTQILFSGEGCGQCDACGKAYEPDDLVDILIDGEEAHRAAMDGDDSWDLGNCSECDGYHTVVRFEDHFICVRCFEVFDSVERCGWCNERNTGDMDGSFLFGCNFCPGRSGWDDD